MTDNRKPITFQQVLDRARKGFGGTDAEFDYSIAVDGSIPLRSQTQEGSSHTPAGDAIREIVNACYEWANAHMPDRITFGLPDDSAERDANNAALRLQTAAELEAYIAQCRARKFTGWSKHSTGPIQYAEMTGEA